jgi:hypothetical protein
MAKKKYVRVIIGYYPHNTGVTFKQLDLVNRLLDEKGYEGAYNQYITKWGMRNPQKRINPANITKLINALNNDDSIAFLEK